MKRITESEKQRIIELHRNTPMKPYLPINEELLNEENVPFRNSTEGNQFRTWVNNNYPKIAKRIDLDRNSPYYNNSYITSAWNEKVGNKTLGQIYTEVKDKIFVEVKLEDGSTIPFDRNSTEWQKFYYDNNLGSSNSQYKWNGKQYEYDWSKIYKNWSTMTPDERKKVLANRKKIQSVGSYKENPNLISSISDGSVLYELTHSHEINTIVGIGVSFIPFVGPVLAAGIGAWDAYLYYKEGDAKMAGFVGVMGMLPLIGQVTRAIPFVAKLGDKGMVKLAQKINKGGMKDLTKEEANLVKDIGNFLSKKEGKQTVDDFIKQKSTEVLTTKGPDILKKSAQEFNNLKKLANGGIDAGVIGTAWTTFDPIYNTIYGKTAKEMIIEMGQDYEVWKNDFGSDGSPKDDELMKKAMEDKSATNCGPWKRGRPVPLKYQTEKYKNDLANNLELIMKAGEDCRFPGTFGKPMSGIGTDPYEYVLYDGKYYTKKKDEEDWTEVTTNQTIKNNIDSIAKSKGLVKDKKGLVYVK